MKLLRDDPSGASGVFMVSNASCEGCQLKHTGLNIFAAVKYGFYTCIIVSAFTIFFYTCIIITIIARNFWGTKLSWILFFFEIKTI